MVPPRTPLHYAAANGRYQCTVTLVSAGAEVNEPDQTGCTPLHYSAASQAFCRSVWITPVKRDTFIWPMGSKM